MDTLGSSQSPWLRTYQSSKLLAWLPDAVCSHQEGYAIARLAEDLDVWVRDCSIRVDRGRGDAAGCNVAGKERAVDAATSSNYSKAVLSSGTGK